MTNPNGNMGKNGAGISSMGMAVCKLILNGLHEMASRSMDRRRFAALGVRDLDDIGLTIAQRDDMLH